MSNENYPPECGPGGICGSCPTPCFLSDTGSFDALVARGPLDDYDDLSEAQFDTDAEALGCFRWEDPDATCDTESCIGNFFCFASYEATYSEADHEFD